MDRLTKVKLITTVICMLASILALYTFIFVADVSGVWRTILIVIVVFWLISGIINLVEYWGKQK